MLSDLSRRGPQPEVILKLALLVLCASAVLPRAAAQALSFEYLFTLGAKGGVNPPQKFSGRFGKLFFGSPERISPLVAPDSVTVDAEERIWITDPGSASVHMFDVVQNRYKILRGGDKTAFQCPSGIDSDAHGRIYVADACLGQIFVFDKEGEFLRFLIRNGDERLLQQPAAVAVSRDLKSIFVTDPPRHKVVVLNQEGETIREWGGLDGPGELYSPTALALDEEKIFVLDSTKHRVQVFSPAGSYLASMAWPEVRQPSAIAFDAERRLFFVGDPRFELVQVFNENGISVGAFGQKGSGVGELRTPANIYIDFKNRIYVVDSLNGKVLVFRQVPSPDPAPWSRK